MSIQIKDRSVSIELSGALIDNLDQIASEAERRIIRSMEAATREVMEAARSDWPVKSGRTRDSFRTVVRLIDGGSTVQAYITNDATSSDGARYPFIIRTTAAEGFNRRWTEKVSKPLKKRAKKLARELEVDLIVAAGG